MSGAEIPVHLHPAYLHCSNQTTSNPRQRVGGREAEREREMKEGKEEEQESGRGREEGGKESGNHHNQLEMVTFLPFSEKSQ